MMDCRFDAKQMQEEAKQMQDFLEVTASDDTNELVMRLSDLNSYIARSGYLLAQAKQLQDAATMAVFAQHAKAIAKMPPTIAKLYVASAVSDENYLVNWLDRINRSCVHIGDNIRTQISFAKEELRLTKQGY